MLEGEHDDTGTVKASAGTSPSSSEHAVDLDTGAVVAADIHPADEGDTTTLPGTLKAAV